MSALIARHPPVEARPAMADWRCPYCGHLLGRYANFSGTFETKCRCSAIVVLDMPAHTG